MPKKNRTLKKTQKALGYHRAGAMLPPGLYADLCTLAARGGRSLTAEIVAGLASHVERGQG